MRKERSSENRINMSVERERERGEQSSARALAACICSRVCRSFDAAAAAVLPVLADQISLSGTSHPLRGVEGSLAGHEAEE